MNLGDKYLPASTDNHSIIAKLTSFLVRVCQIPPKPRVRTFFSNPRLYHRFAIMVLAPTIILCSLLAALLIPTIALEMDLNNPDWSWTVHDPPLNYKYIDEDFILFNRPFINVSEYPLPQRDHVRMFVRDKGWQRNFNLQEDETAIWRDCIIYTHHSREMARFGYTRKEVEVREDWHLSNIALEVADTITLHGFANLTLINVTFYDYVTIRVTGNASLTIINCTNRSYDNWYLISADYWEWPSGSKGPGHYRFYTGAVEVEENATVWIEGTTLGVLTGTWYSQGGIEIRPPHCYAATLLNASIHYVRLRCQSPIQVIDSEIHELYADEDDVEQRGTTHVTHVLPFSYRNQWCPTGRGPDIAYRSSIRVEKQEYRWGEPVNVAIRIENLGFQSFTLYFNGTDRFSFNVKWFNESAASEDAWVAITSYTPDHSVLLPQLTIAPGDMTEVTLTWYQDPPVPPGRYYMDCVESFPTLHAQFRSGFTQFNITDTSYSEAD
jgi:hypothetical protein